MSTRPMGQHRLGRHWGWVLGYGIFLIVVGIFAMLHPLATGLAMGVLLGVSFLFSGVGALIAAFKDAGWQSRAVDILFGLLSLLAAGACIVNPFSGAVAIVWIIGVVFLIMGGFELAAGFRAGRDRGWLILLGVIDGLLGAWAAFFMPADTALVALATLVGFAFLFRGALLSALAFRLRGPATA